MDFLLQGGLNGKHLAFMCEIEGKETGYGTKKDRKGLKMGRTVIQEGGTGSGSGNSWTAVA